MRVNALILRKTEEGLKMTSKDHLTKHFDVCCKKLDMLKIWGCMVADCYYDNQTSPNIVPIHWSAKEIKSFRNKCRRHNRCIRLGLDPDVIPGNTN